MEYPEKFELPAIDAYHKIQLKGFHLIGRGIGGVESVYSIPEWNITFDTGRAPSFAIHRDYLALTHFHLDHAGGLAFYLGLRCLNGLKPLKIIVPASKLEQAQVFLDQLKALSESQIAYEVLTAEEPLPLKPGLFLEAIPSFHCTDSTGYLITETKNKLIAALQGKDKETIIAAKNSGQSIYQSVSEILFAYSGDSTGSFFKSIASQAKVLLMECTFFGGEDDYQKIQKYGHTHIDDWCEFADQIQSETVIMTHTSQRYDKAFITKICQEKLPQHLLERLVLFR